MTKYTYQKFKYQDLRRQDRKAFQKICRELAEIAWSSSIEWDDDWGWMVLATKKFKDFGIVLKRIKPYRLDSLSDFQRALRVQQRLRNHLVEIVPYKIFLGNKIHVPAFYDFFDFLSEANFSEWGKYFKSQKFSLKSHSIDEAKNLVAGA